MFGIAHFRHNDNRGGAIEAKRGNKTRNARTDKAMRPARVVRQRRLQAQPPGNFLQKVRDFSADIVLFFTA
ncbi:hypothetical protein [uncultured Desulfovibrio sp.]|uniref:hypothetical protein n=1 Tax=uncultured Desulfovibrio sp. TaxID=167968 RepID=UPI00260DAE40|nr:hypothetical protein [uncultured Desulfovibrio sp.]